MATAFAVHWRFVTAMPCPPNCLIELGLWEPNKTAFAEWTLTWARKELYKQETCQKHWKLTCVRKMVCHSTLILLRVYDNAQNYKFELLEFHRIPKNTYDMEHNSTFYSAFSSTDYNSSRDSLFLTKSSVQRTVAKPTLKCSLAQRTMCFRQASCKNEAASMMQGQFI